MLNTIEQRVAEWSDLAIAGVPADAVMGQPEYDVYRRAFRLKRFYRCPRCDERKISVTSLDFVRMGWNIWCRNAACYWAVFVWDCVERTPDDLILDIVRGVVSLASECPTFGEGADA